MKMGKNKLNAKKAQETIDVTQFDPDDATNFTQEGSPMELMHNMEKTISRSVKRRWLKPRQGVLIMAPNGAIIG